MWPTVFRPVFTRRAAFDRETEARSGLAKNIERENWISKESESAEEDNVDASINVYISCRLITFVIGRLWTAWRNETADRGRMWFYVRQCKKVNDREAKVREANFKRDLALK